ncbi:helix-turn-helix domain-containing protein, partial [Acidovorax sp. Leaf160]|uniref:helix-turn-helix domain-containing protein n=1 Tax=Acidovorax sp. Leaf160 TaxID=1736280 RepID=UPI0012E3C251
MSKTYRQLSEQDRETIMAMKLEHASARSIAQQLNRAPSTITRELKRNGYQPPCTMAVMGRPRIAGGYDAHRAGVRSRRQRRLARPQRKLHPCTALWAQVRMLLEQGWSPAQIAATLKRQ